MNKTTILTQKRWSKLAKKLLGLLILLRLRPYYEKFAGLQPFARRIHLNIKTRNVSKPLDEEIIRRCMEQDEKAQEAFYRHFSSLMYAVCLRYSNSREDAKDILQDGFVKVFTRLGQYSGKGSLEGWMKRVFINTALEHYRVNKVYQQQSDVEEAISVATPSMAVANITQKEILAVMEQMPPGYRNILNLYAIEGYTHAEIAEMLGISEGTSKSQLSRARQSFIHAWNQLEKKN